MALNGRLEKELHSEEQMKVKLSELPQIFTDFYYFLSNKSYLTRYNYINHVRDFMDFISPDNISNTFYQGVTPLDINRYMASLRTYETQSGLKRTSDSALAAHWSSLNAFYKFLYLNNLVQDNIVTKTERPKIRDEKKKPFLTKKEIKGIKQNIEDGHYHKNINRDKLIFALGITTGLRVSAISQLNLEDINLENNTLQVIEKGNKYRTVEFGDNLKSLFQIYLVDRETYYSDVETNALFLSQKKTRIGIHQIGKLMQKYSSGATDKHITPHSLRRTSATQLYNKTGDIYLVGNHLGHSDISTTKRYITIDEEKQKNKVSFMDSII
jgi:site-specific recombinase XerD